MATTTTIFPSPPLLPPTPNPNSHAHSLKLSTTIQETKQIHAQITRKELTHLPSSLSHLIASYSNLSTPQSMDYALKSFKFFHNSTNSLDPNSTLFILNSLIRGFSSLGSIGKAIELYLSIITRNLIPNRFTFPPLLAGLSKITASEEGTQFHGLLIKFGIKGDVFIDNSLIHFYCEIGDLDSAQRVFGEMSERNVVSWTSLIDGYAKGDDPRKAISLFFDMLEENRSQPNSVTMACVISACAKLQDLELGEKVCGYIVESGISFSTKLVNALVDMYMKCGVVEKAKQLFNECVDRNVVVWNTMITNYARLGMAKEALAFFNEMLVLGTIPDRVSVVGVVSASAQLGELAFGRRLHGYILRNGLDGWDAVSNSVIDMYMKCGDPNAAFRVFELMTNRTEVSWNTIINGWIVNGDFDSAWRHFEMMPRRDLVSWNTMIGALTQESWFEKALSTFRVMQCSGLRPDGATMVSVSSACGYLGSLELAKWVYTYIDKSRIVWNVKLGTALVDMFAKCGDPQSAMKVFDKMPVRDVFAWTAAIGAMAAEGNGRRALELFAQMVDEGVQPDTVVFVGVLTALSHGGLVEEGRQFFESMQNIYGFHPQVVHYGCMVDLLGRAGLLKEARMLIQTMPVEPNDVIWGALLAASHVHQDLELAEYAAERVLELAPERSGIHVLLSNAYASAGKWKDVARVRLGLRDMGIRKLPGSSLIEVDSVIHEFTSGEDWHPQMKLITKMLKEMDKRLAVNGHVPDLANVLVNVDEEEKELLLSRHSERMAVAFGLISTNRGVPIRIVKNLRICGGCHEFMKFVSAIYSREVTIRDNNRFHHFREGLCSCMDYW